LNLLLFAINLPHAIISMGFHPERFRMLTVGVLTISDKGWRGEREDESGEAIKRMLTALDAHIARYEIVPDEKEVVSQKLTQWADEVGIDLIVTTGSTGLSPRDIAPEATLVVVQRLVPGLAEAMRAEGMKKTATAMLSRGVSGIRGRSLIINLPGSPKAVRESLEIILPVLPHAMEVLRGEAAECGKDLEEGRHGH
jgi:molybdenum cofactor synthesis domain-containing protein